MSVLARAFSDNVASRLFARLPAMFLNAALVTLGVALIDVMVTSSGGPHRAQLALSGAICTSLADVPGSGLRIGQRVAVAAALSFLAALCVEVLKPHSPGLGLALMAIGFVAISATGWGPWAAAISFAPLLSAVFTMATPSSGELFLSTALWNGIGGTLYVIWAFITNGILQRRYASLALSDALSGTATLFRARCHLLESWRTDLSAHGAMRSWVQGEAALATQLQQAREILVDLPVDPLQRRDITTLLKLIELRYVLLASSVDLEFIGTDAAGRDALNKISHALGSIGAALDASANKVRGHANQGREGNAILGVESASEVIDFPEHDQRRELVPTFRRRLVSLAETSRDIEHLLDGSASTPSSLPDNSPEAAEKWPFSTLVSALRTRSTVFRHAVRMAVALGCAYFLGQLLPWASHAHWVILTVAVVLRGSLDQTLARRNSRVLGTLIGCIVVAAVSLIPSAFVLQVIFLLAVGVAHAFIALRYWLTALAATVMALLQAHLLSPSTGFAVSERALDTILGALIAWAFSFVFPAWERRYLPKAMRTAMKMMLDYSTQAFRRLEGSGPAVRIARRQAYDSLGAISSAMERSAAEPSSVQLPQNEISEMLDYAYRLMAHVSMIRILLDSERSEVGEHSLESTLAQATACIHEALHIDADCKPAEETKAAPRTFDECLRASALPVTDPPWLSKHLSTLLADACNTRVATITALQHLEVGNLAG